MRHYEANFNEKVVADLYFQRPIEKERHIINDIKGDFIKRLEADQIYWNKINYLEDITGGFICGFIAATTSPSNGYTICEVQSKESKK